MPELEDISENHTDDLSPNDDRLAVLENTERDVEYDQRINDNVEQRDEKEADNKSGQSDSEDMPELEDIPVNRTDDLSPNDDRLDVPENTDQDMRVAELLTLGFLESTTYGGRGPQDASTEEIVHKIPISDSTVARLTDTTADANPNTKGLSVVLRPRPDKDKGFVEGSSRAQKFFTKKKQKQKQKLSSEEQIPKDSLVCKYKDFGCKYKPDASDSHELTCSYATCNCPMSGSGCSLSNLHMDELMSHLIDDNAAPKKDNLSFQHNLDLIQLDHGSLMPLVIDDGKERFYLHFEAIEGDLLACVFKIEDVRGVPYKYQIEASNDDNQRQVLFQAPVTNVRGFDDVKTNCDYFFVKRNLAQLFSFSHCASSITLFVTIQEVPFFVN